MLTTSNPVDLPPDQLDRDSFIKALIAQIDSIAAIDLKRLPAPRVIAVDAAWGQGKSWLANALKHTLDNRSADAKTVMIDAFRYDHHDDAFAVIAASLMAALRPNEERKRNLLRTAGQVLKVTTPAVIKGVSKLALSYVGIDSDVISKSVQAATDAAIEGAADFSEDAVERLFDRYASTQSVHDDFIASLGQITSAEPNPVVVLIDELDRCRPTFALEILERIKHLFTAPNIVFVLFWNGQALHESIKHTYGRDIDASSYLSKFVALELPLSVSSAQKSVNQWRYMNFLINNDSLKSQGLHGQYFGECMAEISEVINPTLRDAEKAVLLYVQIKGSDWHDPHALAFLLLLRLSDKTAYNRMLRQEPQVFEMQAMRFDLRDENKISGAIRSLRAYLRYLGKEQYFKAQESLKRNTDISAQDTEVLELSHNGHDAKVVLRTLTFIESKLIGR